MRTGRPEPSASVRPEQFRNVLGHYPTGVAVVAGLIDGRPVGMVVGTFTSVSLAPPLVAFLPRIGSRTFEVLRTAPSLTINVLAHDQRALCERLARPGPDQFDGVELTTSTGGGVGIVGSVAQIDCRIQTVSEAGDHYFVLCDVTALAVLRPVLPLLFFQGGYGAFSPRTMSTGADAESISAVRLGEVVSPEVAGWYDAHFPF